MQIERDQMDDLVRRIVEAAQPLRIVLFGSAARGEAGPYSDIDVLVVMPDGVHRRRTAQIIYRHLLGFGLPVDVVVATCEDMERYSHSPSLVYKEALKDGRELYAA
jgi:predicted nucleotidyltransferase